MASAEAHIDPESYFISDEAFGRLYPSAIQQLAYRHWSPLDVAKKAANYLVTQPNTSILDIGSGVGKFCLAAAHFKPGSRFVGIEQRQTLVEYAENARKKLGCKNASFITGNFTSIEFSKFDHFYFYNPFYENLLGTPKIDSSLEYSAELFNYYNANLCRQLQKMPEGTRLVTFHMVEEELTDGYHVVGSDIENSLKYWVKI